RKLDDAAEVDPASPDLKAARAELAAARQRAADAAKAEEERKKRADAERKRLDEERKRKEAERKRAAPERPAAARPDAPPVGNSSFAGRTATLSRISAARRAVMRIQLHFGAGGALGASCTAEAADGGQEACFGQRNGGGRWSSNGSTLCLASAVINLPANTCYQVSGSGNQYSLSGPGFLAGAMFLR
ncbi:MAG: hypothetical protein KIT16_07690, partial [Rhodospirillaceae bacterium]|nr:hypothetical protein [Rhodospirillaceae bacterium]